MAQSVEAFGEPTLFSSDNASYSEPLTIEAATPAGFSLLQNPTIALGFCFLIALVVGRLISGSKKLPHGVKALPRHPGALACR